MDMQILKAIVQSRSEVMKDVDDPEAFNSCLSEEKFPLTDPVVLAALIKSFTNLLSYKVAPEAYQRYSVRIQVIEILREWLRPSRNISSERAFLHSERVLELTTKALRMYLKIATSFKYDGNIDILITIARALICLVAKNKTLLPDLEKLLEIITGLKQTEASQKLILSIIKEKEALGLNFFLLERFYVCQRAKLIEEPLANSFVENIRGTEDTVVFKDTSSIEELLKVVVESPTVFQISSSILKEILIKKNYSLLVIDYIKFFLNSLDTLCREKNKNTLDLYPLHLQSCVLLLRIEPRQHSPQSREYVLKTLEKISESSSDETLILLSHYSSWLPTLSERFAEPPSDVSMKTDDEL